MLEGAITSYRRLLALSEDYDPLHGEIARASLRGEVTYRIEALSHLLDGVKQAIATPQPTAQEPHQ